MGMIMPLDAHGHGGDHHDWKKKVELWMVIELAIMLGKLKANCLSNDIM